MKFSAVAVNQAVGKILGHNIAGKDGRRILSKGKILSEDDIQRLLQLGRQKVYVAELEPGDVEENQAALRIASYLNGENITLSRAAAGRVNLLASTRGILRVDAGQVGRLNQFEGITLATLPGDRFVRQKQMVGTVKIIPYAVPDSILKRAEASLNGVNQAMKVDPLPSRKVGLILTGSPSTYDRLQVAYESPLRTRVNDCGSELEMVGHILLDEEEDEIALSGLLSQLVTQGYELVILAGETAVMDPGDIVPRAIERAGGKLECVGLPVDPGNMLMLAYLGDVPILGAPGCARSLKTNAIDWVLPRLLLGEYLKRDELMSMGYGGLLEDTYKRPMPRSRQRQPIS
jgi:molybdenum cofactor cytidylyltransferase